MLILATITVAGAIFLWDIINIAIDSSREKRDHEKWNQFQQHLLNYKLGKRSDYPCIEKYFPEGCPYKFHDYDFPGSKK